VRHEAAEARRTAPRLSCRHGEESRRNARNKRDETGPVGCASCHLHCMSPACLPFAFHVRVIRTTVAATAAVSRCFCYPRLLFAARFRDGVRSRPASACFAYSLVLSPYKEGGRGRDNSRRRRPRAPRRVAARLITLGRAPAIEMFN